MLNTQIIGNKIAKARKKLNISQAQLSQRLFISSQAVGKWERGESMPDITTFNRLAEILGVDLNYFSESFEYEDTDAASSEHMVKQISTKQEKKPSWDMSLGNWVDADFSGLKNLHEKFSSSNMQRCKFIGSDLSGLLLKTNNLDSCDFSRSTINSSNIERSHFVNNLFKESSLKGTTFLKSYIKSCDFSGADFSDTVFKSGGFENNTITNAVWNRTSFIGMHIEDVTFDGSLEDCYFENCLFKWVKFENSTLINVFFKNNRLDGYKRIRFMDCRVDKLTYEFLKIGKADLTGITLVES